MFTLQKIIDDIRQLFIIQCQFKDLYLKFEYLEADIQRAILSDEKRVKQIIINLISNALKVASPPSLNSLCSPFLYCFTFFPPFQGAYITNSNDFAKNWPSYWRQDEAEFFLNQFLLPIVIMHQINLVANHINQS